jgi:hypothetical protein
MEIPILKTSDVYTGFVEIGGRELRPSGIQIVIGRGGGTFGGDDQLYHYDLSGRCYLVLRQ